MRELNEHQFIVKIEGYKESLLTSYGKTFEEARSLLEQELNSKGFMDILYIEAA